MKHYKRLLLEALRANGWELKTRVEEADWWAEEHWHVHSVKENWGFELVLSFMVDPQYEGDDKSRGIYEVVAATEQIRNGVTLEDSVIKMDLRKGIFDTKLVEFIGELNQRREIADS